jgi:hypothetical protein
VTEAAVSVRALYVHPVKSCAAVEVREAAIVETGFDLDRAWMVVDEAGAFVTQRELPRMALIRPTLKTTEMVLRAPGMLALHVALDTVEAPTSVTVWNDRVEAYDMGDLSARWFSNFLGQEVRLARFDIEQRRLADRRWTGAIEAETAFQDGFPLLVVSSASLAELNRRLVGRGEAEAAMTRFRPNIVLDGLDAHAEDGLDEIVFESPQGPLRFKLVKPCARCPIPDVDPATGVPGHAVGDVLRGYRADPRRDGAVTFGMNAVIVEGLERTLRVGMHGSAGHRFD